MFSCFLTFMIYIPNMSKFLSKGSSTTLGIIIIIILVVVLVGGILIYQLLTEDSTKDVWLKSWEHRRLVIIQNQRDKEILDHSVLLQIDTSSLIKEGKMASDCRDIRFTDPESERFLGHWIEGECDTKDTKLWVQVAAIPANSQKTIHLYYGNQIAEDKDLLLPAEDSIVAEVTAKAVLFDNQIRYARALNGDLYCVISQGNAVYLFQSKDKGKTWQREKISANSNTWQMHPTIELDSSNNINVVWQDGSSRLYYRQKTAEGWGEVKNIVEKGTSPVIAVDMYNNMHVVYTGAENNLYYWPKNFFNREDPLKIAEKAIAPSLAMGSRDNLSLVYGIKGGLIGFCQLINGEWSEEETIVGSDPIIVVDFEDNVHLIYQTDSGLVYQKKIGSDWSQEEILDEAKQDSISLSLDGQNNVYVVFSREYESGIYLCKRDSNGWSEPEKIIDNGGQPNLIRAKQPEAENVYSNIPRHGFALTYLVEENGVQNLRSYTAPFTVYQTVGFGLTVSLQKEQNIKDFSK